MIFPDEMEKRAEVAAGYHTALSPIARTPVIQAGYTSVFAQYTIEVSSRDAVQVALRERGVPTAVHYPVSLHQQPAFKASYPEGLSFPHAEKAATRVLSLPMHPYLTDVDQAKVTDALQEVLQTEAVDI